MDIVKVFGGNLKKYRTALGLSQEAFAARCGMHRTYISAIECYRRRRQRQCLIKLEYDIAGLMKNIIEANERAPVGNRFSIGG